MKLSSFCNLVQLPLVTKALTGYFGLDQNLLDGSQLPSEDVRINER